MIFRNLLLTGAAGLLGSAMRPRLARKAALLRSTDIAALTDPAPNEELVQADLADPEAAARLAAGMDAIVHFGGISKDESFERVSRVNIGGLHALYEAARLGGVRRVVFASSVHAVGYYLQTEVIDARSPTRPDSFYGLSKVFGEALAQLYWDKFGIETVSIRIGSCEPSPSTRRHLRTWLSFDDLEQLLDRSLTVPRVGHTIVFGMSGNAESFWDNRFGAPLGYRPKDTADDHRAAIEAAEPAPRGEDPQNRFQGGVFVSQAT